MYAVDEFEQFQEKSKLELMLEDLNHINLQIAELQTIKEKITWKILDELKVVEYHVDEGRRIVTNVAHEGQQTRLIGKFKATISTLVDWKIDVDEYLVKAPKLSDQLNPVKAEVKYSIVNRKLQDLQNYGSDEDKKIANTFLIKRFANPSIKLTPNA
ncbi:MAG: hypothetical protein ACRC1W_09665 [Shewanella sp.]